MDSKQLLYIAAFGFFMMLCLAYSNHFNNGFYFDDSHTIVGNPHIKDLSNLPTFFTDGSTSSTLPGNQAYRPMVTVLNAIDYWFSGDKPMSEKSYYFHRTIFVLYVIQLVLLFFMFRNILLIAFNKHKWTDWIALFGTAFYGLHTANAETINYIIARSDSFSTLCMIATILLFQMANTRKLYLYLIPLVLGIFTKQTGVMVVPLLFMYVLFFEEKLRGEELFGKVNRRLVWNTLKKTLPAVLVGVGLFLFNQLYMTPDSNVAFNDGASKLGYITTQFYVLAHYVGNFILPINLSADPDIYIFDSHFDHRIILGVIVLIALLAVAAITFKNMRTRPISYGILWFYVAAVPTSILPRFQVANDHRTFLPYIGFVLAVACFLGWQMIKREEQLSRNPIIKYAAILLFTGIIGAYAYGTHVRNDVWSSKEKLWRDVTIKSPKNPKGYVNLGLVFMSEDKKDYNRALEEFNKSLALDPNYTTLHINMAALKRKTGNPDEEIEEHYKMALKHGDIMPASYLFYAGWLREKQRYKEAKDLLKRGLRVAPGHVKLERSLGKVEAKLAGNYGDKIAIQLEQIKENPTAQLYLELSDSYYGAGKYKKVLDACEQVLALEPNNQYAFNNKCCAYNKLKQWDNGIAACKKALQLDPNFELAKGNLSWAEGGKKKRKK